MRRAAVLLVHGWAGDALQMRPFNEALAAAGYEPLERRAAIVKLGSETGFVPPVPAQALGVTLAADLAWVTPRVAPQPFRTFNEPLPLHAPAGAGLPCAYFACVDLASGSFGQFAAQVRDDPAWTLRELRTGHNAMITAPALLADALLALP